MKIKSVSAITVVFVTAVLFNSCKKNDVSTKNEDSDLGTPERLTKVQQWLKTQKNYTYHPVNQRLETYRANAQGDKVDMSARPLATGPGCYPTDDPTPTLEGWASLNTNCGSTPAVYEVFASFIISAENAIVYQDPNDPSNPAASAKTRGRLSVTATSGGASIYNAPNIVVASGDITNIGVDPSNSNRNLYRVTYLAQNVPAAAISGGTTIRLYITYYTECEEESVASYNAVANIGNLTGVTACNVVNTIFVNPSLKSVSGSAGCAGCCIPSVIPKFHYISFVRTSDGYTYNIPTLNVSATVFPTNVQVPTGYTYKIYFRNANYQTYPPGHPQQGELVLDGSGNPILECLGPVIQTPLQYSW